MRRRLFLFRRAAATGLVWFGLAWLGLVGIDVVGVWWGPVHLVGSRPAYGPLSTLGPVLCLAWVGPNFPFCGHFAHVQ